MRPLVGLLAAWAAGDAESFNGFVGECEAYVGDHPQVDVRLLRVEAVSETEAAAVALAGL